MGAANKLLLPVDGEPSADGLPGYPRRGADAGAPGDARALAVDAVVVLGAAAVARRALWRPPPATADPPAALLDALLT